MLTRAQKTSGETVAPHPHWSAVFTFFYEVRSGSLSLITIWLSEFFFFFSFLESHFLSFPLCAFYVRLILWSLSAWLGFRNMMVIIICHCLHPKVKIRRIKW